MTSQATVQRISGYCALCRSRCGCISVVENGHLLKVEPDPSHPTGKALCGKGRAAPELVYNPDRVLYPLRRTRPKGDPDPGWERISWDEALDYIAATLRRLADTYGPETVAFSVASPSATAISDAISWIERFIRAFGSPNTCYSTEICNWHKDFATRYTFGVGIPSPDFDNTACVLLWGHNPSTAWLNHATGTLAARRRGARVIVVDPRRAGLATKADLWLRVRPGSDGALALGIASVMIQQGWFDHDFIRDWSNGPLLVRSDSGRFLTEAELLSTGSRNRYVAWDEKARRAVTYDPATASYDDGANPALFGSYRIPTLAGIVECQPAFELYTRLCQQYPPKVVERITTVPEEQVWQAAWILYESRPVSYYVWTGVGQHTNATQTDRAIAILYALTGSFDAPGGNVIFPAVPTADVAGWDLISAEQQAKSLGLKERPLGPARWGWITSDDLYRAILEGRPYQVRGLFGFGTNLLLTHADVPRAKRAFEALEFMVQSDLFMTPTAEMADIFLPIASCWETENLKVGFEINTEAQSVVQLRPRVVMPVGEACSDTEVVFELARRLGLGAQFWHGDIAAAYHHLLGPSGISLDELRNAPNRQMRVALEVKHRKYAEQGFNTPSRKIEIYSETFLEHGYPPLPDYVEPLMSPTSRPDLAARYPLVLTSAKLPQFCHSQHRALPSLRRHNYDPELEIHPSTALQRGIEDGEWVIIETIQGRARARARLNDSLHPQVVCGQYGWWQACEESAAPGYDPYGPDSANYNLLIGNEVFDPISGSVPHRSYLCEVQRAPHDG